MRKALRLSGDLANEHLAPAMQVVSERGITGGSEAVATVSAILARSLASISGAKLDKLVDTLIDPECISADFGHGPAKLTKPMFDSAPLDVADVYELLGHILRVNFTNSWKRAIDLIGAAGFLQETPPASSVPTSKPN